jgi:hypothetical protein
VIAEQAQQLIHRQLFPVADNVPQGQDQVKDKAEIEDVIYGPFVISGFIHGKKRVRVWTRDGDQHGNDTYGTGSRLSPEVAVLQEKDIYSKEIEPVDSAQIEDKKGNIQYIEKGNGVTCELFICLG